jgi:Putative abortive phage resistance protein AbiGi, antitoxin
MPLSANTVFHLAENKSSLQGILLEDFRVHYCLETITLAGETFKARIPMVSFCDIPLSEIKDHIFKYGNYGIGLTKEWAQRSGLNPVLYMESESLLAHSYSTAFHSLVVDTDGFTDGQRSLVDVLRYFKNYQAALERKGKTIPDYRYSVEREWRYVPPSEWDCEMIVGVKEYLHEKAEIDRKVETLRLKFTPNDIKYIIIESDDEIAEFVNLLRNAKGKTYLHHDVERLMTRLITVEQIRGDM